MNVSDTTNRKHLIDLANRMEGLLDGTMATAVKIMLGSDVFFCVWRAEGEPDGVGVLLVKGDTLLRKISRPEMVKVGCVWVLTAEDAEALRGVCRASAHS